MKYIILVVFALICAVIYQIILNKRVHKIKLKLCETMIKQLRDISQEILDLEDA